MGVVYDMRPCPSNIFLMKSNDITIIIIPDRMLCVHRNEKLEGTGGYYLEYHFYQDTTHTHARAHTCTYINTLTAKIRTYFLLGDGETACMQCHTLQKLVNFVLIESFQGFFAISRHHMPI